MTVAVHDVPGAIGDDDLQSSVMEKLPRALTGPMTIAGSKMALVRVTVCGALLVPTFWLPKSSAFAEGVTTGFGTVTGIDTLTLWPP